MKTLKKSQYELIAEILASFRWPTTRTNMGLTDLQMEQITNRFCYTLEANDSKFDRNKFLEACGVETVAYNATSKFVTKGDVTTISKR